jgi:hypothetical protein
MKLALTTLCLAVPAAAFAPTASFGVNSALKMSTEEATSEKVRRNNLLSECRRNKEPEVQIQ